MSYFAKTLTDCSFLFAALASSDKSKLLQIDKGFHEQLYCDCKYTSSRYLHVPYLSREQEKRERKKWHTTTPLRLYRNPPKDPALTCQPFVERWSAGHFYDLKRTKMFSTRRIPRSLNHRPVPADMFPLTAYLVFFHIGRTPDGQSVHTESPLASLPARGGRLPCRDKHWTTTWGRRLHQLELLHQPELNKNS